MQGKCPYIFHLPYDGDDGTLLKTGSYTAPQNPSREGSLPFLTTQDKPTALR